MCSCHNFKHLLYDIILPLIVIHFWQKILAIKNPLDLVLAPSKGGCDVYIHVTRSQLELKRARCKIGNKGYLSLNIFFILCHNSNMLLLYFFQVAVAESWSSGVDEEAEEDVESSLKNKVVVAE